MLVEEIEYSVIPVLVVSYGGLELLYGPVKSQCCYSQFTAVKAQLLGL